MPYKKCVNIEQENAMEEMTALDIKLEFALQKQQQQKKFYQAFKLKSRIKSELESPALLEDDPLFYKLLKARDFNVDKAEKMLRKHIVWRKVYQIDHILETFKPQEFYVKCIEPNLIGCDKDGDIVRYIAVGRMNCTEVFKCIKMNDVIKNWIWFVEKNKRMANETGKRSPISAIIDLDKLELANTTSKQTVDIILRLSRTIRDNYSESVKALYMINAPSYFVLLYSLVKAVMSNSLIKRMHVFGYSGWQEKLLETIDADVLPAFLGGKRTDPDGDPYCKSFITVDEKIPEHYYLSEEERFFEHSDEVNTLTILPSEKKEIFLQVKEEHYNKVKEIIPMYEYDTSDGTEGNSYKCLSTGRYIIIFDNSHSMFSSKEVQYSISVKEPES